MVLTLDLPPDVAARVSKLARERGVDEATLVTDLTRKGLSVNTTSHNSGELGIKTHPETGWPSMSIGRPITQDEVSSFLDEEGY